MSVKVSVPALLLIEKLKLMMYGWKIVFSCRA